MKHYTLTSPRHKQKLKLPLVDRPLTRWMRRLRQFPQSFNKYKSTIERFSFGQFRVRKPLPDFIDIGSNRQSSIQHRAKKEITTTFHHRFSRWMQSIQYRKPKEESK